MAPTAVNAVEQLLERTHDGDDVLRRHVFVVRPRTEAVDDGFLNRGAGTHYVDEGPERVIRGRTVAPQDASIGGKLPGCTLRQARRNEGGDACLVELVGLVVDLAVKIGNRARRTENALHLLIGRRPVRPTLDLVALDEHGGSVRRSRLCDDIHAAGDANIRVEKIGVATGEVGPIGKAGGFAFEPPVSTMAMALSFSGDLLHRVRDRVLCVGDAAVYPGQIIRPGSTPT